MEEQAKELFLKELEETCSPLISQDRARQMTLQEGIDFAMTRTIKTDKEIAFTYNPTTRKITSSIVEGKQECVNKPLETLQPRGLFHTHPKIAKKCEFSVRDVMSFVDLNAEKLMEIKIGCPTQNEIITIRYQRDKFQQLMIVLSRIRAEAECYGAIKSAISQITDDLKQKFPDMTEQIESSRKKIVEETEETIGWVESFHNSIEDEVDVLQQKLEKKIPIQREKWKE